MRIPVSAGNWKMNLNVSQSISLVDEMIGQLDEINNVEKVLCPPFTSLYALKELTKHTSIKLGAQNMYYKDKGAYTGEISPTMVADLCEYVIVGHSERRQYFHESDASVNQKIKKAFESDLIPIFCVGESYEENNSGKTEDVISRQVTGGLMDIKPNPKLIIAYEPVWAIGTGKAATSQQANNTIYLIRNILSSIWNKESSTAIRILYGGSVTNANIAEFISQSEIDGTLIGGASLSASDFIGIVSQTAHIKNQP